MPPRVVSLAVAGRKLNAPPEAYGPKKQLQVKGWLRGATQTDAYELSELDASNYDDDQVNEIRC